MAIKCLALSWALLGATNLSESFSFIPSSASRCSDPRSKAHDVIPRLRRSPLFSSKDSKNLSAAGQARREEEKRRRERKSDVVIGKTSALPDAKDYAIDPTSTEEEWMRQASKVERQVFLQTEKGMEMLKLLRLEEADEAFDEVFVLRPNAYLWQAGIAKFYLNDLEGAADIFARNAATYESKFGEPASEERIWRDACQLKMFSSMDKAARKAARSAGGISDVIAQVPEHDETESQLPTETRKVLRITRDLFAATLEENHSAEVLARAKLRSICGAYDDQPRVDRKMWRLSAWFYLGLHYDAIGEEEESRECMKMALRVCPGNGSADDIIHTLPLLHMARRDLFDDDEFEEERDERKDKDTVKKSTVSSAETANRGADIRTDPVVIESIRKSISKMRIIELQSALKARGLKYHGSKEALGEKLFKSLLEDSGLDA